MLSYGISSESSTSVIKPYNLPSKFLDKNNKAYLIFNHYNNFTDKLPSNLRYIPEYHIVASGQFTKSQFKEAIKNVRPIIDVDLRGEYHGFNNDLAVSFKTLPYDDINLKKSQSEIISTEKYIFNLLG